MPLIKANAVSYCSDITKESIFFNLSMVLSPFQFLQPVTVISNKMKYMYFIIIFVSCVMQMYK